MLAEVEEPGRGGQAFPCPSRGCLRHQHLATMAGRHDAGRPIHRRTEVVAGARLGRTDMDPDAYLQWSGLVPRRRTELLLCCQPSGHGLVGRLEDGHYAVARGLDDAATRMIDSIREDLVVAGERSLHGLWMLLPKARARLEI